MKINGKLNPNRSLSARLSLWVAVAVATVQLTLLILILVFVRKGINKEAEERARVTLDNASATVSSVLASVEAAVRNSVPTIENHIGEPDFMYTVAARLCMSNPEIFGASVSFEENFFRDRRFFSAYASVDPVSGRDSLVFTQLANDDYDYLHMDWYQIPKLLDRPYWSEPYMDSGGGNFTMVTYSYPLRDAAGNIFGMVTADVSLNWLTDILEEVEFSRSSYNIVLSRNGTFIVHPVKDFILGQTIFTYAEELGDESFAELGRKVISGEDGSAVFRDGGGQEAMFYSPIERIGWSMAIICPTAEFFRSANALGALIAVLGLLGLAVIVLVCHLVLRRMLRPLRSVTESAQEISRGNFGSPLPEVESDDEMRLLRDSFATMQTSLVEQMNELAEVTQSKGRIEGELQAARQIQISMLPKTFPPFPDLESVAIYGQLSPAKEVGGDLYDFVIQNGKVFFCIGDVSGKGVPASLLMVVARSLFRNLSAAQSSPARIVSLLNNALSENNSAEMFVTFFAGVLDLSSGELRFCNAGHNPPVLMGSNVEFLALKPNLPLGVMPGWEFEEQVISLAAGESLFLYTDGLSEAENPEHQLFGDDSVLSVARRVCRQDVRSQIAAMTAAVTEHAAGASQSDDLTMMSVQYIGSV
ncbi:MAG: SpoIIE family protein phosphatase [Bacteroidales bacterium]|nr:SpoIIE family protein phosphatase [Bacteroidales bacterium]